MFVDWEVSDGSEYSKPMEHSDPERVTVTHDNQHTNEQKKSHI